MKWKSYRRHMIKALVFGFLAFSVGKASSQTIPEVEVIRLAGPGTEPTFRQWADSMEFSFHLKSGIVADDPDLKYIVVSSDSFYQKFSRNNAGVFEFSIPNYWSDTVFIFSFFDSINALLGQYPVTITSAAKHFQTRGKLALLPEATVLWRRGLEVIDLTGNTRWGRGCGGFYCGSVGIASWKSGSPILGIYQVPSSYRPQGKIPTQLSPKVQFANQDLPGVDLNLKLEIPNQ